MKGEDAQACIIDESPKNRGTDLSGRSRFSRDGTEAIFFVSIHEERQKTRGERETLQEAEEGASCGFFIVCRLFGNNTVLLFPLPFFKTVA